jgi:hypothetical protein
VRQAEENNNAAFNDGSRSGADGPFQRARRDGSALRSLFLILNVALAGCASMSAGAPTRAEFDRQAMLAATDGEEDGGGTPEP